MIRSEPISYPDSYVKTVWTEPVHSFDDIAKLARVALDCSIPCGCAPNAAAIVEALIASQYFEDKSLGYLVKAILEFEGMRRAA